MSTPSTFAMEIRQMMYVAGEKEYLEVTDETVNAIESIIRDQVKKLIDRAKDTAALRGTSAFGNNDLIVQFAHDTSRLQRVQTFLNAKAEGRSSRADEEDIGNAEAEVTDVIQDEPVDGSESSRAVAAATIYPWDTPNLFSVLPPGAADVMRFEEQHANNMAKLRTADAKTSAMSTEEYILWSECRRVSFTRYRVSKFKKWCGLGVESDVKATEDALDILGFLANEIVQNLTKLAMKFQEGDINRQRMQDVEPRVIKGPFQSTEHRRPAVEAKHVREAFQLMQLERRGRRPAKGLQLI